MKKNLYFRQMAQREKLNHAALGQLINFTAYPRLVIEVFIRKNFGERYFTLATAQLVLIGLIVIPVFNTKSYIHMDWSTFLVHYATWYLFIAAYYVFSVRREREIKREPSVFEFGKYSLYSGDIDPRFYRINGGKTNIRKIETSYEPLLFLIPGIVLALIGQPLGWLLITCSFCYAAGSSAAYKLGDDFVMNTIDEMIFNEELEETFVNDKQPEDARGVRFYGRKPADEENRRKVVSNFTEEETVPLS